MCSLRCSCLLGDDYVFTQMFVGCWTDSSISDPKVRDFHTYLVENWYGMTLAYCVPACKSRGFPIAALQVLIRLRN